MQESLVHGEGDFYGQRFHVHPFQRAFVKRAYQLEPDGSRRYRRALLGLPSGNGKTELAAALACAELYGPVCFHGWDAQGKPIATRRVSPDIPVAAASFDQADLLFGAARIMLGSGPIADRFDIYDTVISLRGRPGKMYRVAAKAGTNDGKRPTFVVADELHEWECTCEKPGGVHVGACKARVYTVLSKGRAKRRDAWELAISTAGWRIDSLLGELYEEGRKLTEDGLGDPRFLFEWIGTFEDVDMTDAEALERAISAANPGIAAGFLLKENVKSDAQHMAEYEFRRYHLNQWVSAPDRWLPVGSWEAVSKELEIAPKTRVVLGFDGSVNRDSTALIGCTVEDPHLFTIALWEETDEPGWLIDVEDVKQTIRDACDRYDVLAVGCDPFRWQLPLQELEQEGLPILEWPTHQGARMAPASQQFYEAVIDGSLSHDGDARLAQHLANCVIKRDSRGVRIAKVHKKSKQKIDMAVAAVIAYDLAVRQQSVVTAWTVQ